MGYKFNAELHKQSASLEDQTEEAKACQDVDECADNNGDCQQVNLNISKIKFLYISLLFTFLPNYFLWQDLLSDYVPLWLDTALLIT